MRPLLLPLQPPPALPSLPIPRALLSGLYLSHDESVHHRNGVRDENRPDNLDLWVRP